ncbi:MAG: hypothetical protein IT384_21630 [Deltaproteobacteria bacterium]|nr:hypothetical protein [Deltaproteobacteria bacterium]
MLHPMSARATLLLALLPALSALSCGNRFVAEEDWGGPVPELRVVVLLSSLERRAVLLADGAPFETVLGGALEGGERAEVWLLGYSVLDVTRLFPGLEGKSASEIAGVLSPALGGARGLLVPPTPAVLSAQIREGGARDVRYQRLGFREWLDRGVELRLSVPLELACDAVTTASEQGPAGIALSGVVATSSGALFVGTGTDSRTLRLFAWHEGELTSKATLPVPGPIRGRLAWDVRTDSGYLVDRDGGLLHFGARGEILPVPAIPIVDAAKQRGADGISAGLDGTVMAQDFFLFLLRDTGWDPIMPVVGQERPIQLLHVVKKERVFFLNACWATLFSDLTTSTLVAADAVCGPPRTIRALDADPEGAAVAGDFGRISILVSGRERLDLPDHFEGRSLLAVASLRGGRHLFAGDGGALGVWLDPDWCQKPADSSWSFRFAAASTDGTIAFVVAAPQMVNGETHTPFVVVRLPP